MIYSIVQRQNGKYIYKLEKHSESADFRQAFYALFKAMLTKISK